MWYGKRNVVRVVITFAYTGILFQCNIRKMQKNDAQLKCKSYGFIGFKL